MELILVLNNKNRIYRFTVGKLSALSIALTLMIVTSFHVGSKFVEYQTGEAYHTLHTQNGKRWKHELEKSQADMDIVKRNAEYNLGALSAQLGALQARLLRIDALGSRLVELNDISDIEFYMLESPGLGGPSPINTQSTLSVTDFIVELQLTSQMIEDQELKLSAIESMLLERDIYANIFPQGNPIKDGWMSSPFGWRSDPISGKKEFHKGIDLVGKPGEKVSSVAGGIVTWSDKHAGYGNMVEVSHGDGYVTRYAHNKNNLVVVGEKIKKGQSIAIMGSSGRSTGHHVHFEVVLNGQHINPRKFIPFN